MDRRRKITWEGNTKIDIYIFLFVDVRFFFVFISDLLSCFLNSSPIVRKVRRCKDRLAEGVHVVRLDFFTSSESMENSGGELCKAVQDSWGVRALGTGCVGTFVTDIHQLMSILPKHAKLQAPFWGPAHFHVQEWEFVVFATWTLYSFAGRGKSSSVVHVSVANWRYWLPADMFTVFWYYSGNFLTYFALFFPLKTTRLSSL